MTEPPPPRIVCADDSPTVRALLQDVLEGEGFELTIAANGLEAIEAVYHTWPDVVVLDIEMPRVNGYQVCRLLKNDPATRAIPVLILTSRGEKSDRFWGLAVGADAYLVKESEQWQLLGRIRELLDNRRPMTPEELSARKRYQSSKATLDAVTFLEQVNTLLDRKLYLSTLVDELGAIVRNVERFSDIVTEAFQLLGKVCEFQMATLYFGEEELYLCRAGALSVDFEEAMTRQTAAACTDMGLGWNVTGRSFFEVREVTWRTKGVPRSLESFVAMPLRCRGSLRGVFTLGSGRANAFTEHVSEMLNIFCDNASIVLDNALLVRDLTRTRLEHGNIHRELASLRSRLEKDGATSVASGAILDRITIALEKIEVGRPPDKLPENILEIPEGQRLKKVLEALYTQAAERSGGSS